jgi:hypothetical protein
MTADRGLVTFVGWVVYDNVFAVLELCCALTKSERWTHTLSLMKVD